MAAGPRRGPFRGPRPSRRRLIQSAVATVAAFVPLDFLSPLSEPVRIEPGLSAAWTQYHSGVTVPAATFNDLDWVGPLSTPVRSKPSIAYQQPFVTDSKWQAPPEVDWRTPLSEPIRARQTAAPWSQYTTGAGQPSVAAPNIVYQPLSEPVQSKKAVVWQQPFATDWKPTAVPTFFFQPLSEPVQVGSDLDAAWRDYATGPASSLQPPPAYIPPPLSEPVRVKQSVPWQQPFSTDWKPTVVVFNVYWFSPLSEPVKIEPGLSAAWTQYFGGVTVPAPTVTVTFVPPALSEPVRVKSDIRYREPFTTDAKWTPPTPLVSMWHQRLAEPVWPKKSVPYQQPFVTDWTTPFGIQTAWYARLSEPVRVKRSVPWQRPFTWGYTTPAAVTVTWGWFGPLSEPPSVEGGLSAAWQQVSAVGAAIEFVKTTFEPLSEPVRIEPGLGAAWTQYHSGITTPAVVTVAPDFFFNWLSEPVRGKQAVPWQQFFTTDWKGGVPTPLVSMWYRHLAEPVQVKKTVAWQQPFTTDWKPTVIVTFTPPPLSEPVRNKQAVPWQQSFTTDWTTPFGIQAAWYARLSEPVRTKLSVPWQQPFTTDWQGPIPAYVSNWHRALSEPVRSKQAVAYQQPFTIDWKPAAAFCPPPLSEPVRFKKAVVYQQPFTTDWKWSVPVYLQGWYEWLGEPVRQRPGLHASRQMFFQTDWNAPVFTPITYTLSVTETGDGSNLRFLTHSLVYGADVTITEIWVENLANVTITEVEE